jgi:aspartate ammonia-lyase
MSFVITTTLLLASSAFGRQKIRVEKDLLGEKEIPADAYYGVQTARALENFQGYEKATELAAEAYKSGKGILEIIREKKICLNRKSRNCSTR